MSTSIIWGTAFCFHFKCKEKSTEATDLINSTLDDKSVSRSTVAKWFARFRDGNLSVEDEPRPGARSFEYRRNHLQLGLGNSPACGLFTRHGAFRLPLVQVDARAISWRAFLKCSRDRKWVVSYFPSKPPSFYRDGIRKLPGEWQFTIDNHGNYFEVVQVKFRIKLKFMSLTRVTFCTPNKRTYICITSNS